MKTSLLAVTAVVGATLTAAGHCCALLYAPMVSSQFHSNRQQEGAFTAWLISTAGTALGAALLAFAVIRILSALKK